MRRQRGDLPSSLPAPFLFRLTLSFYFPIILCVSSRSSLVYTYIYNKSDIVPAKSRFDHNANITAPATARTAVKPTLTEVEEMPLLELLPPGLVLLEAAPDAVPVAVPIAVPVAVADEEPDGATDPLELRAPARKALKVLPDGGAFTAKTIPSPQ